MDKSRQGRAGDPCGCFWYFLAELNRHGPKKRAFWSFGDKASKNNVR